MCTRISCAKTAEPIETQFGGKLTRAKETLFRVAIQIPHGKGHFRNIRTTRRCVRQRCRPLPNYFGHLLPLGLSSLHGRNNLCPPLLLLLLLTITGSHYVETSCCSTEREMPHRCLYLPNNTGSHRIFPIHRVN